MKLRLRVVAGIAVAICGILVTLGTAACDSQGAGEILASPTDAATLSTQCSALEQCCPSLPAEVATSCMQLALESGADECGSELTALANVGKCLGDAGALSTTTSRLDASMELDGGTTSDGGNTDAANAIACVLLEACCTSGSLPSGEVTTCESIQGAGNEEQCAALFNDLSASDECGGAGSYAGMGGACPTLSECCVSAALPSNFTTSCAATASAGIVATCAATLTSLASAGFCGGAVGSTDGGHPIDANCGTLAMCCNESSFPASTLSTCQHIAAANVDGECLSALDGYVALNYCVDGD